MREKITHLLENIKENQVLSSADFQKAYRLYASDACVLLYISPSRINILVTDNKNEKEVLLQIEEETIIPYIGKKQKKWNVPTVAALLLLEEKLKALDLQEYIGRQYTRAGMIQRVMEERRIKADNADYRIEWADNIYGEHRLTNERGITYKITLRDFEHETGYIDSPDLRTNKLGTTKHLMYAFQKLKKNKRLLGKLSKQYPFVEIYLDPLNDYNITWYYPHKMDYDTDVLIKDFFKEAQTYPAENIKDFLRFIHRAEKFDNICIRPEVLEKVERAYNQETLEQLEKNTPLDYSVIKADLFPYQKEGVDFAVFKEGAIIADEMGLGKTLQAITIAILKKHLFGFRRTLVICPASLKAQWKSEIEKFSDEKATIVEGFPEERAAIYRDCTDYFLILNYETVLRDVEAINKHETDFIILDEAQRIKNYNTKTAQSIKSLHRSHALVITGTPIENRLIDLYSIVQFVAPYFLAPLWEFSYQHCYFDEKSNNRIVGYYNLNELKERMQSVLIRREKRNVIKQLPNVQQVTIPVEMHPRQEEYHASYAHGIARILNKKYRTAYDMQRLMLLLTNMRMVCNSTNLIDKETNYSPKLIELKHILLEKLDMHNNKRKIIIFSEWVRMHNLIGELLRELNLGYVELSGKIPVKKRGKLIEQFEQDDECRVFLSTEAGGAGLNLQVADTVINFELPWNPAKKNQRIGRIDRLGQKHTKLTVLNLITRNSIETKIATGLILKQNLFEGVLDTDNTTDEVDFSAKGRSQFLQQLEKMVDEFEHPTYDELEAAQEEAASTEGEATSDVLLESTEEDTDDSPTTKEPIPATASSNGNSGNTATQGAQQQQYQQMETVMNKGLKFLAGLYQMSTGQALPAENQKIEIDKETGEVVMRFKMKM